MLIKKIRGWFHKSPTTLSSLNAYAKWAENYPPIPHNPLMETEQQAMLNIMPPLHNKTVLDLACGSGRYSKIAFEKGATCVFSIDNSPEMLRTALTHSISSHFILATTEAIPLPENSIDIIICAMALGHLSQLEPSLSEIARVLKPNGEALISDFHHDLFLSGAQRTFTAPNGSIYAVEHYPYTVEHYTQTAKQVNLHLKSHQHPTMPISGEQRPAVTIYHLQKTN